MRDTMFGRYADEICDEVEVDEPREVIVDTFSLFGEIRFQEDGQEVHDENQLQINELFEIVKRLNLPERKDYLRNWREVAVMEYEVDLEYPIILRTLRPRDIVINKGTIVFTEETDDGRLIRDPEIKRMRRKNFEEVLSLPFIETPIEEEGWKDYMKIRTFMRIEAREEVL